MKTIEAEVKTGKPLKVVGVVEVPEYENVDELIATESSERILSMFNKQNKIRIMGNERAKHQVGRIGKNKRFEIGFELLFNEDVEGFDDIEVVRENCIKSMEVLRETINGAVMQAAINAYIAQEQGEDSEETAEVEAE